MGLTLSTPPVGSPVTLAEAKAHLRVDDDASNSLIISLIAAATDYVERQTRQVFVARTFTLTLNAFPSHRWYRGEDSRMLRLPSPPLIAVQSVGFIDPAGNSQTLSPAAYTVDATTRPGRIVLSQGNDWPATSTSANAVTVTFTAGYGTASRVPDLIKSAIKLLVGLWYESREAATEKTLMPVPMAVESILNSFSFPEVG